MFTQHIVMLKLLLSRLRLFLLKIKTTFVGIFKTPNPVREYKENSQRKKIMNNFGKVVVITLTISFLILFIFPFKTGASERSMTRSTTAEFNQGTTTNISTASDEMKISTRSASWYDANWPYRQKITIDHTKVGTGGVTNFPTLLSGDSMSPSFWTRVKSDGADIRIATSDGTTLTNHELVTGFSTTTKSMELWFLAPSLSSDTDDIFYIYYGNATATAPEASWAQGVWSAAGKGAVWHLGSDAALSLSDSTANTNTLINNGGAPAVAGKISGGVQTDAGKYLSIASPVGTPTNGGTMLETTELWFSLTANADQVIWARGSAAAGNHATRWLKYTGSNTIGYGSEARTKTFAFTYNTNWHHLIWVVPA
ncbi:MAG: hypothetical protein PHW50_03375, partial [Patescibacteria group bacterium]|nr:hypothetical protein [Patescibacteria group bacterium]